jgi:type I restriction enzyme M protein
MSADIKKLEEKLWKSADYLRANSSLRLNEFAEPVLGLIFLKFADVKFEKATQDIEQEKKANKGGSGVVRDKPVSRDDYHKQGVLYIPEEARFSYLLSLSEDADLGKAVNDAMKTVEEYNTDLSGVLPKNYQNLDNEAIIALLKNFNQIPDNIEGDAFGKIYEYFLGKFALADGSKGGEFFTPTCIVKLLVEAVEPYEGRVYDPACGSGGMFVQSHKFIKRHLQNGEKNDSAKKISIFGQEKTEQTVRLAKMNLAIHGLSGDIRQANTYYEDPHHSVGRFDYTLANPPFNVDDIDPARLADSRFPYGLPTTQKGNISNGNYVWIQIFLSSLNEKGRAGFVMANSASDAGHKEKDIRKQMIEDKVVDVMVAVGPNMFYNVSLPVTLWFLDKSKKGTDREDKILFIDAREIYHKIDRAHREFTDEQIERIAGIVRSYRGEEVAEKYEDVPGLCKAATLEEVRQNDYSLNPGRYVGTQDNGEEEDEEEFKEKMQRLHQEFEDLTQEAHELEDKIFENVKKFL